MVQRQTVVGVALWCAAAACACAAVSLSAWPPTWSPSSLRLPFALGVSACVLLLLGGHAALSALLPRAAWMLSRGDVPPPTSQADVQVSPALVEFCRENRGKWHVGPTAMILEQLAPTLPLFVPADGVAVQAAGASGLSEAEARARLRIFGRNTVEPPRDSGFLLVFLKEIWEPTQLLLLIIAVLYALVGERSEAVLALSIICLMMVCEAFSEHRARKALDALSACAPRLARALRDGSVSRI
eukprot:TRINITY_DN6400_c0_g2_i3.p2 TRINITY_DN6400_c0_g2~~TRINITY_DN6400_c0_g2_i3.p2  ORF type:complete len:258 (+),score=61.27 TRINITY_DN6400_c0_g2_i3:51-776(+)